jgi:hypothetical protein
MSQRWGGALPKETANPELAPFSEVLDKPGSLKMDRDSMEPLETSKTPTPPKSAPPVSLDSRYEKETQSMKLKQWQEGPFAAGFTESTWDEEYAKYRNNPKDACLLMGHDDMPCICCSAVVCSAVGATRVGNMAVLKQSTEWVEEEEEDENGEMKVRRFTRPKLDIVVGPVRKYLFA